MRDIATYCDYLSSTVDYLGLHLKVPFGIFCLKYGIYIVTFITCLHMQVYQMRPQIALSYAYLYSLPLRRCSVSLLIILIFFTWTLLYFSWGRWI